MFSQTLTLEFDRDWVLERSKNIGLPVEQFVQEIKSRLQNVSEVEESEISFTMCRLQIILTAENAANIKEIALDILNDNMQLKDYPNKYSLSVSETQEFDKNVLLRRLTQDLSALKDKTEQQKPNNSSVKQALNPKVSSVIAKIDALIGVDDFKALAHELAEITPQIKSFSAERALWFQSYLFAINEGCGISTYLSLLVELINELKLFRYECKASEITLEYAEPNNSELHPVASKLMSSINGRSTGCLICIDISLWINLCNSEQFREVLDVLHDSQRSYIFVFKVPFIETGVLEAVNESLNDVLFTRKVVFDPFTDEEYLKYAVSEIEKSKLTVDKEAHEVFYRKLCLEKGDGRFYGLSTVNKIVNEMIYCKLRENIKKNNEDSVIRKEDILPLVEDAPDDGETTGMEMLSSLIGIEKVKETIEEIIANIKEQKALAAAGKSLRKPSMHMRFIGNPGTGKTTVARILGKIFKEEGILRIGGFYEVSKKDLCGRYVGETAPKTSQVCRNAYGSVLFIDEAYSLAESSLETTSSYAREAIETLIAEMENNRDDMVVIMAGYPDDMDNLMKTNAGLRDRITHEIVFPNYSRAELCSIFFSMVDKNFEYDDDFYKAVSGFFNSISEERYNDKTFSNARLVRNLYERVWSKAALRRRLNRGNETRLLAEDVGNAILDKEFDDLINKKNCRKQVGFLS